MSNIRDDVVWAALNRSRVLFDYNIHNDIHKQFEFRKQVLLSDKSLTKDEKDHAIRFLNETYDREKVRDNSGKRRICENCNQKCFATLFCEYCIRNHLKENFSNWSSGNDNIDNLIQKCQMEAIEPKRIIEYIPYNKLQNIKYLTKGGFSEIYTAIWTDGYYIKWDSKEKQLERLGTQEVILKKLENVENANLSWFEETRSHLSISNKWSRIVECYGITRKPSERNYMLVLNEMEMNLREYLQQNHYQLTWKERIQIIHAPEVITRKQTTKASDIYSVGMLMWEISSGYPPFIDYEHDYYLATKIVNGMRPRIVPGTPLEYRNLMVQCWDADPSKRPDASTLWNKILKIYKLNEPDQLEIHGSFTSKVYQFEIFSEPKNETEEEQKYDDFNKSNIWKNHNASIISNVFKVVNAKLSKILERNLKNDVQNDYKVATMSQHTNEIHNNPNLHSEEQNKLEIPDKIDNIDNI
ncbi:kinase-like domain-containing protein [Rhizophagus clarus]|uniref:Kinase-like domain-containing protein n=1 Tax=Rhizophagus clarus TaxID=94130 RepID=A0A8H3L636_9GLOM|nr:kinase-like domain-containing protein [Rhizophagus clarus]